MFTCIYLLILMYKYETFILFYADIHANMSNKNHFKKISGEFLEELYLKFQRDPETFRGAVLPVRVLLTLSGVQPAPFTL